VDLIRAMAEEEDWTLEFVPGTWAEGLARLEAGTIDLMPDVAFAPDREHRYAFHTEPVLSSWFQIYARRGSGIRSLVDLDGKRVAVLDGSIQQHAFESMVAGFDLETPLIPFPDYDAAFAAVAEGRVDAVVANRFYDAAFLRGSVIEDTAIIFNPTRLFFAAHRKGNPGLLETIDRHLRRMKQDRSSAYYEAIRRWTADDVRFHIPFWVVATAIAGAFILILVLVWNLALNKRVAAHTRELRLRIEENQRLYDILRDRAGELEKRVAERTDELILANGALLEAKEAAESADRLKSAFLATMSHELRTPLNSIIGFTGILLQGLPGPLNDEQRKQLGIVRDSARHLLALINDVLDISKIEAGQLEVVHETLDLRASIDKVAGIIRPLAEKKGLTLTVETAPAIGRWTGDARRVEQILLNLLNNALKFTERGGITLRAVIEQHALRLAVSDTGIGIKPEDQDRIFLPFRQIDTGLSRRHEGTGLGLAICRRLAERMGGTIELHSEPGYGSVFTLVLPATGAPEP
jgi:signal transduction histidine kinase